VAAYNAEQSIIPLIESLERVASNDDEIVICDDASQDKTFETITTYTSKIRLVALRNEVNSGRALSRNRAISASKGEYIAIFDSDDVALPKALYPLRLLVEDKSIAMASSQTIHYSNFVGYWKFPPKPIHPDEVKEHFLQGKSPMSHGGSIIRREILEKSGLYNPKYKRAQDFDLLRRISAIGACANVPSYGYLYNHDVWLKYGYWKSTKQNRNLILGQPKNRGVYSFRWFLMNCVRLASAIFSLKEANSIARELGLK
jgi:glycosyltransferase involved in cell wall biosynthesis